MSEPAVKVYVAICHDRHCDTKIAVCTTLDQARDECLEWVENETHISFTDRPPAPWCFLVASGDDGPWACVEEHEVKG